MSTDIIHGRHIETIRKAAEPGELTVGVLTDRAVSSYKRFPLLSCEGWMKIIAGLQRLTHAIERDQISYRSVVKDLRPDYIVHGTVGKPAFKNHFGKIRVQLLRDAIKLTLTLNRIIHMQIYANSKEP